MDEAAALRPHASVRIWCAGEAEAGIAEGEIRTNLELLLEQDVADASPRHGTQELT